MFGLDGFESQNTLRVDSEADKRKSYKWRWRKNEKKSNRSTERLWFGVSGFRFLLCLCVAVHLVYCGYSKLPDMATGAVKISPVCTRLLSARPPEYLSEVRHAAVNMRRRASRCDCLRRRECRY